ncbi:MAG: glycoside hydrolase family 15 [Candidatus Reconcilbacillus cellulovorans]|uniref:Glycoside hydrolase family 15 n=1 Tax=Candidatus Reconcilbacillus cellulovorans TaxID=1906605 RepID=A0A2A6DXL0_9BACL|nr:MAG: glycoside hydrolase family 15 [Candidatus Reconcilbacillus cellulovorans]
MNENRWEADKKPHLIDAVVGNSRFLASLGKTGRIYRLWWPHVDYPQHLDAIRTGLRLDGRNDTAWFDAETDGWRHEAGYLLGTNVFRVRATSPHSPVAVETIDYAVPDENFFVRQYAFDNRSDRPVSFEFVWYSSFRPDDSCFYHTTFFEYSADALIHLRREYVFAVAGSNVCTGYQAGGNAWEAVCSGPLNGNEIDMTPDGALTWRFEQVPAGGRTELAVYIAAGHTRDAALQTLSKAKSRSPRHWLETTVDHWRRFLNDVSPLPTDRADIRDLYERSLLAIRLMCDERSGGIIAAPEFDEAFSRCGGYGFCWGRDAAFIATALDRAGLTRLSEKFYEWTLTAQDPDGSWQQRHDHDGRLAPNWGLQIDESGSILWGMWQHYLHTRDPGFLKRVWPAVRKGARFLVGFLDPETGLPRPSHDLWEERFGQHTYSAAAVSAGLTAASRIAEQLGEPGYAAEWSTAAERIRRAVGELCWNEAQGMFYRSLNVRVAEPVYREAVRQGKRATVRTNGKGYSSYYLSYDATADVSLLGVSVPFELFPPDDPRVERTADEIERRLTVANFGGLKRYEDDRYVGGNPWVLTTLWLCLYRTRRGQYDRALPLLEWAVRYRTPTGLLPEQIDPRTGRAAWAVPLAWSHAMFVLAALELAERGVLP